MTNTVNAAFNHFMKDMVNLDPTQTSRARSSREFLKGKIEGFDDFFPLYAEKNIDFGSFARKTKIRPLDDIDMIFTLSAHGCTWIEGSDGTVFLHTPENSPEYKDYRHENSLYLNSRKVINEFIRRLKSLDIYGKAELHRNQNAATLKLSSYDWNFDIVPAFFTTEGHDGRAYYIIPDGKGNWMKTDPRIDRKRVTDINKSCDGHVLNAIRAMKYWQRRATMPTMLAYLLENMILDYFAAQNEASNYVDINIGRLLNYIANNMFTAVNDPKEIQGNLNTLNTEDRFKIAAKAESDYQIALQANEYERNENYKKAIQEWTKIFGSDFPEYTEA